MPQPLTPGNCGPRCFCKALKWDEAKYLNDAKTAMGHVDGKGVDPDGIVKAFRKNGWKARWSQNNRLANCIEFLREYPKGVVILNYTDWLFESVAGHYILFYGIKDGRIVGWNPDAPLKEEFEWPLQKFEVEWYDYTIDTNDLLQQVAIFAHP